MRLRINGGKIHGSKDSKVGFGMDRLKITTIKTNSFGEWVDETPPPVWQLNGMRQVME